MPVGDRFSRICEHFTPVVSTEVVCIIANPTHTNDLIMAYTVGAIGKEKTFDHSLLCNVKIMMHKGLRKIKMSTSFTKSLKCTKIFIP